MSLIVRPADVSSFYDERLPPDPDTEVCEVAFNRVAVVVDERGALSVRPGMFGRRVDLLPLQAIPTLPNVQLRSVIDEHCDTIAQFFRRHSNRPSHFEAGLRALQERNLQPLIAGAFFPDRPIYRTDEEHDAAWQNLKANLQPGDFIFTLDRSSWLSRFIAWSTDGAWSHSALHVGGGEIWESVTSGIRNGPLDELYKGRHHWVAAYRHCHAVAKPPTAEEINTAIRAHRFKPNTYNYRGALKFGWRAFRGDHSHALTPNSTVLQGNLVLIAHA